MSEILGEYFGKLDIEEDLFDRRMVFPAKAIQEHTHPKSNAHASRSQAKLTKTDQQIYLKTNLFIPPVNSKR